MKRYGNLYEKIYDMDNLKLAHNGGKNMKSQCNYIPDKIWIREGIDGLRHITLRRNFVEITANDETQYEYEETNIYIVDRYNIEEYVINNFDELFSNGLANENASAPQTTDEKLEELATNANDALTAIMLLSIE